MSQLGILFEERTWGRVIRLACFEHKASRSINVLNELGLSFDTLHRVPGVPGIKMGLPLVGLIPLTEHNAVQLVQRRITDVLETPELKLPDMHTLVDQRLFAV